MIRMTHALLLLCRQLGLLVNEAKSKLIPSQSIVFLGERLDLVTGTAFPTEKRANAIRTTISRILQQGEMSFVEEELLLGSLVSMVPTVPLGHLNLRPLQQQVILCVKKGCQSAQRISHDGSVSGHAQIVRCRQQRCRQDSPFHLPIPLRTVFTDASLEGWGVVFLGSFVAGEVATHEAPYKQARTQGSPNSHSTSAVSAPRVKRGISHRQYDSGYLSQEARRDQVESVIETDQESVDCWRTVFRLQ